MEETCIVCKGKVNEFFGSLLLGATLTCPNCKSLYHYNCSPKKGLVFKKPVCLICNDVELVR